MKRISCLQHGFTLAVLLLAGSGCARQARSAAAPAPPVPQRTATGSVPVPVFTDPERVAKLRTALPEVERLFRAWVERQHMPGAVLGVLIDGDLVAVHTAGVRDIATRAPVTTETMFRIASMTKSFTALAVLRLRDEGKLSLDDPVARYIPELAQLAYPTRDSPVLTIRHLLTHSEGFPEDNPWGDRQLARSDSTIRAWLVAGIPFSTVPGLAYEYSNFGFAILGQVVQRVSGMPYDEYLRTAIIEPLRLPSTTLQLDRVPPERQAHGYRWTGREWQEEEPLAHGSFGAMGGLWTSILDLSRYVAFHMSAWPPRDDAEAGPVRRASVREMTNPWTPTPASALRNGLDQPLVLNVGGYGYALRISQTCAYEQVVGHGGGLPGYGSYMRWLPQRGVGLVAMGNVTYASFTRLFDDALAALSATGGLQPRAPQPAPELLAAKADVSRLINRWTDTLATRIAADNLFLDQSADSWKGRLQAIAQRQGECRPEPGLDAENALRGTWTMSCERGSLLVAITLAPTRPARVQFLNLMTRMPPTPELAGITQQVVGLLNGWDADVAARLVPDTVQREHLRRQAQVALVHAGTCRVTQMISPDGAGMMEARLECERAALNLGFTLNPDLQHIARVDVLAARDQRCTP